MNKHSDPCLSCSYLACHLLLDGQSLSLKPMSAHTVFLPFFYGYLCTPRRGLSHALVRLCRFLNHHGIPPVLTYVMPTTFLCPVGYSSLGEHVHSSLPQVCPTSILLFVVDLVPSW